MAFSRLSGRAALYGVFYGLLLLITLPAQAMLIDRGHVTYDRESGLEWLDLSQSYGMSLSEMDRQLGSGGALSGFRWATMDDVAGLITNNWGSPYDPDDIRVLPNGLTEISTLYFLTSEEQSRLFRFFGAIPFVETSPGGSCQGYVLSGRFAPQPGSDIGGRARMSLTSCFEPSGQVGIDREVEIYGTELKQPDLYVADANTGNWIVRHVPEPLTWGLLLTGLMASLLTRSGARSRQQYRLKISY